MKKGFTSVMSHDISARTFYDPLVLVLGQLSGFKPNRPTSHRDTYDPVLTKLGISREDYGKQESSGGWWVERWMQEAVKALIKRGLACRPARGMWALTPSGVSKAQGLVDCGRFPQPPEEGQAQPASTGKALSAAVGPGHTEADYHDDPYIRALGVKAAACFGAFSEQAPTCSDCPIRTDCINAVAAELSRLTSALAAEDAAARKAAKKPSEEAPSPEAGAESAKPPKVNRPPTTRGGGKGINITCQQAAMCAKCGSTIAQDAEAVWVRSADGDQPGIFHPTCYEAA